MSTKFTKWFLLLMLVIPFVLVACGPETDVDQAIEEAAEAAQQVADEVEAAATENAPAINEAVEEVTEAVEEAMDEAEEAMDEAEEAMDEEAMDEEAHSEDGEMMEDEPCAPAKDGELAGIDVRGVTFQWWHNHRGGREELLLEIVDRYNETNECGITLEALNQGGYNDIRDAVNASVAAGEVPAAMVVGYQNDQAFYQLNDTLADLNTYVDDAHWGLGDDREGYYGNFFDQSIHVAFSDQRLGFPPNRSIELLHMNLTYAQELGFEGPPSTPEEFQEMACAAAGASESGVGGYVLRTDASAVAAWTFAFGGEILTEDGLNYNYDNDATRQALAFIQELATEGEDGLVCAYFFDGFPNPEVAARNALFSQGSSSGIPFYVGDFATIAEEAGTDVDEYVVAAIPHTTPDPVMNIYGGDVMIVKTTPEQQLAAWHFIKWFTAPENQADWVRASNYFPTNAGTGEFLGDYISERPQYGTALDLLQFGKFEPQLISYQSVRDAAEAAFTEILQGADVDSTLADLNETANELQAELVEEIGG